MLDRINSHPEKLLDAADEATVLVYNVASHARVGLTVLGNATINGEVKIYLGHTVTGADGLEALVEQDSIALIDGVLALSIDCRGFSTLAVQTTNTTGLVSIFGAGDVFGEAL